MRPVYDIARAEGAELRQSGDTFRGLCLIHDHDGRNPSCVYGKTRWRCFSCGDGGDGPDLIMKLKGMTFPQALAYLGEERPRPTPQEKAKATHERKKRDAARWRETDVTWTIGTAIRCSHELLKQITPGTLDDFALILSWLSILNYQHGMMIHGDQAARAAVVADYSDIRLFPRSLLFNRNFDYRAWLRGVHNRVPNVETNSIEIPIARPQESHCQASNPWR